MPLAPPPAFYISSSAPHATAYDEIKRAITSDQCEKTLAPIVIGLQVYDLVNTQRVFAKYPTERETDWWNRQFAGKSRRNVLGMALGTALLDWLKLRLTRRSPELRCGIMAEQALTNVGGIRLTNGHEPSSPH